MAVKKIQFCDDGEIDPIQSFHTEFKGVLCLFILFV